MIKQVVYTVTTVLSKGAGDNKMLNNKKKTYKYNLQTKPKLHPQKKKTN